MSKWVCTLDRCAGIISDHCSEETGELEGRALHTLTLKLTVATSISVHVGLSQNLNSAVELLQECCYSKHLGNLFEPQKVLPVNEKHYFSKNRTVNVGKKAQKLYFYYLHLLDPV